MYFHDRLPGLDLRQVEDVVDQLEQVRAARWIESRCSGAALHRSCGTSSQQIGEARGWRSSACGSRGSCSPGTRSWPALAASAACFAFPNSAFFLVERRHVVEGDHHATIASTAAQQR